MKYERLTSWLAGACVVHCLALPALTGFSLFGSLSVLENPGVELGLWLGTALVGYITLGLAFRRHRRGAPMLLLTSGLAVLLLAQQADGVLGRIMTAAGALVIAGAQWCNHRCYSPGCPHSGCTPAPGSSTGAGARQTD